MRQQQLLNFSVSSSQHLRSSVSAAEAASHSSTRGSFFGSVIFVFGPAQQCASAAIWRHADGGIALQHLCLRCSILKWLHTTARESAAASSSAPALQLLHQSAHVCFGVGDEQFWYQPARTIALVGQFSAFSIQLKWRRTKNEQPQRHLITQLRRRYSFSEGASGSSSNISFSSIRAT
jgi:hypothetical protein